MIYSNKISHAIRFAIKTHEVYQKQKRKGKDIPYITHPLTVGLILSRAGASEDVIAAGILHDTIEDSVLEKKVTYDLLAERFGTHVAGLVLSVTEIYKALSWDDRKTAALVSIRRYTHDSLLVKSADVISNASELVEDYNRDGDAVFARFNAQREKVIRHYVQVITTIRGQWTDNPLLSDLQRVARDLQAIASIYFLNEYPARVIEYREYSENMPLRCPVCGWNGTSKESGWIEHHDDLFDVSCPNCEKMLLVVSYPLRK